MGRRWRGEGAQHQGARPYQEDSWALRGLPDDALLAVLADGMGGHAGGSVASRLAVGVFILAVEQGGSLVDALHAANQAIAEGVGRNESLRGMGSTLVAVMVKGDAVMWISVGDSPLYLVEDGKLERLNADHSMVPQIEAMVARGVLSAEEAAHHPSRHTLREAVMGERLTLIDQGSRELRPGGCLLVCSDGIQSLDDAGIARNAARPAQELIAAVLAVGAPAQDNVTVIKLEREA
jgi:serine/threonine protein phosphatase PrpC